MKVEPGQVFLVRHSGYEDPFLVLELHPRPGENYDVVARWSVLNLSTQEVLYVFDSELSDPDPIEEYHALERLF
jgi:hypothetical protein